MLIKRVAISGLFSLFLTGQAFAIGGHAMVELQNGSSAIADGDGTLIDVHLIMPIGDLQGDFIFSRSQADESESFLGNTIKTDATAQTIGFGAVHQLDIDKVVGGRLMRQELDQDISGDGGIFNRFFDQKVSATTIEAYGRYYYQDFSINAGLAIRNGKGNLDGNGISIGAQYYPKIGHDLELFAELGLADADGLVLGAEYKFKDQPFGAHVALYDTDFGNAILIGGRFLFERGSLRNQRRGLSPWRSRILDY